MRKDIEILVYPTRIIKRETKDPFGDDCAAIVCTCYISRMEIYKNFRNRLVMGFDSIEDKTHINAFKPEHAEMIKSFVDNLDPRIKKLYILTDRGISRGQSRRRLCCISLAKTAICIYGEIRNTIRIHLFSNFFAAPSG